MLMLRHIKGKLMAGKLRIPDLSLLEETSHDEQFRATKELSVNGQPLQFDQLNLCPRNRPYVAGWKLGVTI